MRTAHLHTTRVLVATTRCQHLWGLHHGTWDTHLPFPLDKLTPSPDILTPLPPRYPSLPSHWTYPSLPGLPGHTHPPGHIHPLLVTPGGHHWRISAPCEQTHTCENITFLQLRLRAVNIFSLGEWFLEDLNTFDKRNLLVSNCVKSWIDLNSKFIPHLKAMQYQIWNIIDNVLNKFLF